MPVVAALQMEAIECANCGIPFMVSVDFIQRRRNDKATFYCPRGHHNVFDGKTDADLAKERAEMLSNQLARERASHDQERSRLKDELATTTRQRNAAKGQLTKTKNRIARGVCPCCNRHFQDLTQHVHQEHPDYVTSEE